MAGNLIDLRRRIKSVKNTQKSTKAMKTVSAAKLRRSVGELNKTKPMMDKIATLLKRVGDASNVKTNPLLEKRKTGGALMVVISADKGLCGAFNSHLLAKAENRYNELVEKEGRDHVSSVVIGKKAFKLFEKKEYPVKKDYRDIMIRLNHQHALDISRYLQDVYLDPKETIKQVEFVYTGYVSAARQELIVKRLFPIVSEWRETGEEAPADGDEGGPEPAGDIEYIFEPSAEAIFEALLPKYINTLVYQVLLQSAAAEHAARMIAMDQATNNANDMIRDLTLTMNKLRQASITNELLEIITATEALTK
jgi:F-type H+-transporting ATPase subunit gamma